MQRTDQFHRLYFQNDRLLDDDVSAVAAAQTYVMVAEWKRSLTFYGKTILDMFVTETCFAN